MISSNTTRCATRALVSACLAALAGSGLAGCQAPAEQQTVAVPEHRAIPAKSVPDWLKGSIYEQVDLIATEPLRVSNYGVVVNLRGTGDSTAPNRIRDYIINEMVRRGVGNPNNEGFARIRPQDLLKDPRVAIVRIDALIPPGAYKGMRVNVLVSAMEENNTSSLSGGILWRTDLSPAGATESSPGDPVNVMAMARGPVFVNPALALDPDLADADHRRSLRSGVIMHGAIVQTDRRLALQVRAAEGRVARMVEYRVDDQFQDSKLAAAQSAGLVFVTVPAKYRGDWEHFAGVMLHTFFRNDVDYQRAKAVEIAQEMRKPEAPLENLGYAMEALGAQALPQVTSLMADPNPAIRFTAARAAAFIGEPSAALALAQIARDPSSAYRADAIHTLARLPDSPAVSQHLSALLASTADAELRVEIYRALVDRRDPSVVSLPIGEDKFLLDIVPSDQPPIIYASRLGVPRIAIIGRDVRLRMPMIFTAQQQQLSITDTSDKRALVLFYRGADVTEPVRFLLPPDLKVLLARLGGTGPAGETLDLDYPQIVAVLGKLGESGILIDGLPMQATASAATFMLQDVKQGYNTDALFAPPAVRPIGDAPPGDNPQQQPTSPFDPPPSASAQPAR